MNEKLKSLRRKLGLTQFEMSQKLGITPDYYSKIELGVHEPSKTLKILINAIIKNNSIISK